jgi:hypothetical protein
MVDNVEAPMSQGGAGGASAGGNTIDYRQVQAPEQVDTNLPDNGGRQRALDMAQMFNEFSGVAQGVANKAGLQAGAIAGAASGNTGHPQYRQGLDRFTAYSQAFNNAATGAYASQAEASAENDAARLRQEANSNPTTFAATYSAVRDAAVKQAPPMAQAMLTDLYNRHLAAGVSALSADQAAQFHATARADYDTNVQRSITRVATLQGSPNVNDQLQGDDEHALLTAKINGGVNAGVYSIPEAQAMLINANKAITGQVFDTQVDRELGKMTQSSMVSGQPADSGDVVKLIENFRMMHERNSSDPSQPQILSEQEFDQLMGVAKQKLQQESLLEMANRRDNNAANAAKLEAGDRVITEAMANPGGADPTVMRQMVQDMVGTGDLRPEVGRAVLSSLKAGQDAPVNKQGMFNALNDPSRFDWKPADIAAKVTAGDINWAQGIELTKTIETQRQGWEGHAAIKDARQSVTAALKLPPGITMETASDQQKLGIVRAQDMLTKQLNMIPVEKRDAEAPRLANNVGLEIQAQGFDAKVNSLNSQRAFLDKTYAPGGTSFRSNEDYAARKAALDASIKAARDQAASTRQGIK